VKLLIPLTLAAAAAGLSFAPPQEGVLERFGDRERIQVHSHRVDGELRVSVKASDKPLDHIISELAAEVGLTVSGFEDRRQSMITAELHDRPLDLVLEILLGSVGLEFEVEGNHLAVLAHDGSDQASLLRSAKRGYQRALNTFPDHERAPEGYLSQAWIAEVEGDLGTAIRMYEVIPGSYPNYPQTADAHYHIGRLNESLGSWRDAVHHYNEVSELLFQHDFDAEVRLGQARCKIELGDPTGAIYLIQALDVNSPALDDEEAAERILVRARARNKMRDYQATLADLDHIDQLGSRLIHTAEYLRCTAVALEGLELYGPAGRAWMGYAERATGDARIVAVELAVELFLDAGDETSALYAARFGRESGGSDALGELESRLRSRLFPEGSREPSSQGDKAPLTRLERARAAWAKDELAVVFSALSPLMADPRDLTEQHYTEALGLWARCLEQLESLDAALDVLRDARPKLEALESRMRIDVVAAELYEKNGMFDEEVDAYGGTYR